MELTTHSLQNLTNLSRDTGHSLRTIERKLHGHSPPFFSTAFLLISYLTKIVSNLELLLLNLHKKPIMKEGALRCS
jgi:hypothetical protein